jgi:hypothetical protein
MNYIDKAKKLRPLIENAVMSLDDKSASEAAVLFPKLKYDGALISAGARVNHNGVIMKAAVDLYDTEIDNPDNAPTLWEAIEYRDGYRIIPTTITVTSAFQNGELGWWNDELYKSLINANVYTPDQHPAGWEKVD